MTVPADDPRDALAQEALAVKLHAWRYPNCADPAPHVYASDRDDAAAILADGSRFLSPAQAAEQDRLAAIGAAVERLFASAPIVTLSGVWRDIHGEPYWRATGGTAQERGRDFDLIETTLPGVAAAAAALDEPVTGEPGR